MVSNCEEVMTCMWEYGGGSASSAFDRQDDSMDIPWEDIMGRVNNVVDEKLSAVQEQGFDTETLKSQLAQFVGQEIERRIGEATEAMRTGLLAKIQEQNDTIQDLNRRIDQGQSAMETVTKLIHNLIKQVGQHQEHLDNEANSDGARCAQYP